MTAMRPAFPFSACVAQRWSAAVLALAATLVGTALASAEAPAGQAVVYKQCYRPGGKSTSSYGRFPECGIDEAATGKLRQEIDETTRPVTPAEEQRVEERVRQLFVKPLNEQERHEVLRLLTTALDRLTTLLSSDVLRFTATDQASLREQIDWIGEQVQRYESKTFTKADLQTTRQELGTRLGQVHSIVLQRQRETSVDLPPIESLVTRIDDLVARVGTVLRDVEREGLVVPATVRRGHVRAVELVRESKRTCSTRRPAGCSQLREVLDTLEAMRGPLCGLPSKTLTFCHP